MRLFTKFQNLLHRGPRLRRLEEEMRTHIELLTEEGVRQGLAADEARRRAHLAFGNVLSTREEAEDSLGWPALESLAQDAKIAVRSLVRRPAFSLSLIAILALGIGVTTAILTLVRGVLWEPLPVPAARELQFAFDARERPFLFSTPAIRRLETGRELAGGVIAYTDNCQLTLRRNDLPAEPFSAQFVNGGFFSGLQLGAALGRTLTPADDRADESHAVAVISWSWWQRKLGADPAAVGRSLRLNGIDVTIVGVAPANFSGVAIGDSPDAWMPLGLHATLRAQPSAWISSRDESPRLTDWIRVENVAWLRLLVRARTAVSSAQQVVETAWRPQLAAVLATVDDPAVREQINRQRPQLAPSPGGYSSTRGRFRTIGLTLTLLVGAVILVTAANSSTLLLLRQLARSRELGVRIALGAGRWRLARAALMEGLVLSLAGAITGALIGVWLTPPLAAWLVPQAAGSLPAADPEMLLWLGGLAVVLGLALGAAPAWLCARLSPQTMLQQRGPMFGGSLRLGRGLIALQLALSVLLVSVAASLARDLQRVLRAELGYGRQSVVTTFFDLAAAGIPRDRQEAAIQHVKQIAQALPGVKAVGFAQCGVLSGSRSSSGMYFRGDGVNQPADSVQTEGIDEGYFSAMGMALLRGRGLSPSDGAKQPHVAVISQALARQVFGQADPIGRRFGYSRNPDNEDCEIVGVVADVRVNSVREEPTALLYLPLTQSDRDPHCLAIRTEGDATQIQKTLQRQISAAAAGVMFTRWATIEERVAQQMHNDRAAVWLTAGFGTLAVLLAIIGVVGSLGYLVANRARDIAVRLAIGAEPQRIWRSVVGQALALGTIGGGLGCALALAVPRWLGSWMRAGLQVDAAALALAVLTGLAAALIGGIWPARRAAKVDPLTLLKAE